MAIFDLSGDSISFKTQWIECGKRRFPELTCKDIARLGGNPSFVKEARDRVGQAILDGAVSFVDPHYKGAAFPLWVVTYWEKMGVVKESKQRLGLSKLPDKEQKELAQQLGDILKEHRERGISTGAGQVPATRSLLTQRTQAMKKFQLPVELENARVSTLTPLRVGGASAYGLVLFNNVVMIERVSYFNSIIVI